MHFDLDDSINILSRTPMVFHALLDDLPKDRTLAYEAPNSWNLVEIMAHMIHCEETDWIPRLQIVLANPGKGKFKSFDPKGFAVDEKDSLDILVQRFKKLRKENLKSLLTINLGKKDLNKKGIHPEFGEVSIQQLLAAWVAHDLNHISQANRVLAKQFKADSGPWVDYLRILQS